MDFGPLEPQPSELPSFNELLSTETATQSSSVPDDQKDQLLSEQQLLEPSATQSPAYSSACAPTAMEFSKNYSDELLGQERSLQPIEADLAEFELTNRDSPEVESYSKSFQPIEKRKSSTAAATTASEPVSNSEVHSAPAPPDFKVLRECLISNFEQFSDIFYWEKPAVTGIIFATGLALLIAYMYLSIISVVAYSALLVISASSLMRLYRAVMSALNKSSETPFDHVWEKALKTDLSISSSSAQKITASINASLAHIKSVLLVEEKISTLKFGSFLFALTFLGSWFNGLTLLVLVFLALFTLPIVYKKNKIVIDSNYSLVSNQVASITSNVTRKFSSMIGSPAKKEN